MKPFNLEEAKAGKPVCTRDGRPARLIYQDLQGEYPFVFAITSKDGVNEKVREYNYSGQYYDSEESKHDLCMVTEKKTVWVNLFNTTRHGQEVVSTNGPYTYATEAEARAVLVDSWAGSYIGTFPITYED